MYMNRLTILLTLIVFGANSGKTLPVINTSEEGQHASPDFAVQNINPGGNGTPRDQKAPRASNDSPIQKEMSANKQRILAPVVENGSPIQRSGAGNSQEHARPIEIENLSPIMENGSPVQRGGPGHHHEPVSPIETGDLTRLLENGSPVQRGGSGHFLEHATPIGIQGTPLPEIVTPIFIRDYPETTGNSNDAFLLNGLRIPDTRTLRMSSADLQVLNEFASWIESNGLGNIQSRFGRSVSKKRHTGFLKSEKKSFNPSWLHIQLRRKKYRDI